MEDTLREYHCYNYFDTPDGKDIGKKIWSVTKYSIPFGILLGTWEITLNSRPETVMKTITRFSYIFLPTIALPATWVAVTNHLAKVRGKDDTLNWVAGGLAASLVPLVWRRTIASFLLIASTNAASAALAKYYVQNDIPFTFKKQALRGGIWVCHDYTLTKNIPGNYIIKKK